MSILITILGRPTPRIPPPKKKMGKFRIRKPLERRLVTILRKPYPPNQLVVAETLQNTATRPNSLDRRPQNPATARMRHVVTNFLTDPRTTCPVARMFPFLAISRLNALVSLVVMIVERVENPVAHATGEMSGMAEKIESQGSLAIIRTVENLEGLRRNALDTVETSEIVAHLTTRRIIVEQNYHLGQHIRTASDHTANHGQVDSTTALTKVLPLNRVSRPRRMNLR